MIYFLSNQICLINIWPYRLTVRTKPSQGLNPGSIPGRVTIRYKTCFKGFEAVFTFELQGFAIDGEFGKDNFNKLFFFVWKCTRVMIEAIF